ncbi:hypothetical protein V1477_016629 [Vespula maculifrons]|uniref:Uncharacterized protein n=1 Tax=Vespula maculifrons TaxID=7453 RepID=A0ABD2B8T9_VESMC
MPRSYIRKQQLKKYHKKTFYISTNRWTKNTAENVKLGMEARKANMQRTSKIYQQPSTTLKNMKNHMNACAFIPTEIKS